MFAGRFETCWLHWLSILVASRYKPKVLSQCSLCCLFFTIALFLFIFYFFLSLSFDLSFFLQSSLPFRVSLRFVVCCIEFIPVPLTKQFKIVRTHTRIRTHRVRTHMHTSSIRHAPTHHVSTRQNTHARTRIQTSR